MKTYPWNIAPLNDWSICGMNHYNFNGERYLFVAMTKDRKVIKAEGSDDVEVWNNLFKQAGGEVKFKLGEIIRSGSGPTALMKVDKISILHGGIDHRYYGRHCMGGSVGQFERDCQAASPDDLTTWVKHNPKTG